MHIFRLSIICLLILSSLSAQEITINNSDDLKVLESILKRSKDGTKYYKTIIKDRKTPIASYVEDYLLEFNLCAFDVDTSTVRISDNELSFLKQKFSKQKVKRIDRLFPKYKSKTTKKHERFKTASISMPVTFRNGTMALYFASGTYGAEFNLLNKKHDKWESICSSIVWIE